MIDHEYEYRLKRERLLPLALLTGAAALFFAYMALTNDRGLIINRIIPLSKNVATVFYAALAIFCGLGSAIGWALIASSASRPHRIAFTKDGLIVPKPLFASGSSEEELIPYGAILDVKELAGTTESVVIRHREGSFILQLAMLPDERAYAEIVHNLVSLVEAARAGVAMPSPEAEPPKT